MKDSELIKLKKMLEEEKKKREEINDLLDNQVVQRYLELTEEEKVKFDLSDDWLILEELLKSFKIKETNEILVCTNTFYDIGLLYSINRESCLSPTYYDNKLATLRTYVNIEDGTVITDKLFDIEDIKTSVTELSSIVLNPYNSSYNYNGYDEVRQQFFLEAIKSNQSNAKKLILSKYPKMGIKKRTRS